MLKVEALANKLYDKVSKYGISYKSNEIKAIERKSNEFK